MSTNANTGAEAKDLARQAEDVAAKLKAGTWEAVQALSLLSIAKSLSSIAAATSQEPNGR